MDRAALAAAASGRRGVDGEPDGVLDLLRRLRVRVGGRGAGARGGRVRSVSRAYERLLTHRDCIEDEHAHLHHELARIRQMVTEHAADVFRVVDEMDRVVERCTGVMDAEQRSTWPQSADVSMSAALRLLVALAGGEDGCSFVLEDPTRVRLEEGVALGQKRIGDHIRMDNADLVGQWAALFERQCVPLQQDKVLSTSVIGTMGAGISSERKELWDIVEDTPSGGFFSAAPGNLSNNRFMTMSTGESPSSASRQLRDFGRKLTTHQDRDRFESVQRLIPGDIDGQNEQESRPSDVFFWDGTQQVASLSWKKQSDWDDDATSLTENSSTDDSVIFGDSSDVWSLPQSNGWESVGDRQALPHVRVPIERGAHQSLESLGIPIEVACRTARGIPTVQVHADDLIEDALHSLCGVDSVLLRRDGRTAEFVLPRRHHILLHNATLSSTEAVLQTFREAGTHFIRLEFLAIFYAQDPRRGGKSLQAFGSAILSYLSAHQAAVTKLSQSKDRIRTVTSLVVQTRRMRRVLEALASALGCDRDDFWALIVNRECPRGIALLNFLHERLASVETWDTSSTFAALLQWLLEKASVPFLESLSDIVAEGTVSESTDPHDEFDLTGWTRELAASAEFAGGDKLLESTSVVNADEADRLLRMFPSFLQVVASRVLHLSRLQRVLHSVADSSHDVTLRRETLGFHFKLDGSDISDGSSQSPASESLAQSCTNSDRNSDECDDSHHRSSLTEAVSEDVTINQADETMDEPPVTAELDACQVEEGDINHKQIIEADEEMEEADEDQISAPSIAHDAGQHQDSAEERDLLLSIDEANVPVDPSAASTDERPAAGVPVNAEGGSEWRFSVRVNTTAGHRNANIFGTTVDSEASTNADSDRVKGSVRVLREPGGGGDAAYDCLYDNAGSGRATVLTRREGEEEIRTGGETIDLEAAAEPAIPDSHSERGVGMEVDSAAPVDVDSHGESRPGNDELIKVQKPSQRIELPSTHPFFAANDLQHGDTAILTRVIEGHHQEDSSTQVFAPFALLVDAGIVQPVQRAVTNLDSVVLRSYLESTELVLHLDWLRRLMLMSEGLCMDTLVRDVLSGLTSSTMRAHWSSAEHLSSALSLAMAEAANEYPAVVQRFQYRTTPQLQELLGSPMSLNVVIPQFVRSVELTYSVEWPLGVIITSELLRQYAAMHSWLMHVRLTVIAMKDAWALLRVIGRQKRTCSYETRRALMEVIHQTQHVIRAFNETFCTTVLMSAWTELTNGINSSASLLDVRTHHERYVDAATKSCFLDDAGREVHESFEALLDTAWRTSELLYALEQRATGFASEQERAVALREAHATARRRLATALDGVGHDRPRSVRAFAECLLVRIDFNSYYCGA